jgi:hypothetical protein
MFKHIWKFSAVFNNVLNNLNRSYLDWLHLFLFSGPRHRQIDFVLLYFLVKFRTAQLGLTQENMEEGK